jgi:thymidylate synthase
MYKNATFAFQDVLADVLCNGQTVLVRDQEVKELRSHMVRIASPLERVYVLPQRNNNIFAMIAETLWVIAGRNDLEYLIHYLPRAVDFSDDGRIWRGGYGPRLRNWQGVDQIKEILRILSEDPQSRRAVIILFDPTKDFVDSKDIPCNNWLHFLARDNNLHMSATIRSNDAMWGFSGINTFEWSVLHEMMAYWTDNAVGDFSFFISSFHLYERHYKRAQEIIASAKDKTLYDFGFAHAPFHTSFETFDAAMLRWFEWEKKIRNGKISTLDELSAIKDNFLRNCAEMLYIYSRYLTGAGSEEIAFLISSLPPNDFKIAAIEYFTRKLVHKDLINLSSQEGKYFQYFWDK